MGKIRQFDPAKDVHSLEKKIKEVGGANLVIIDPIVSVVSGDTHKNAETRRGLQPLVDLALCTKVAIIGITHLSKGSKGNNPIERVTGSLAFGAVARAVFLTISKSAAADNSTSHQNSNNDDTDQSSVSAFVRVKSNIGPTGDGFEYQIQNKLLEEHSNIEASFVKWGKAICGNAQSIIAQYEATEETFQDSSNDVVKKASQFLIEFLNPKASWSVEVKNSAQEIGISPSALNRAKNVLRIVSTKQSDGKWFWSLPDTTNFD
jgi:RecA-family ATPase